MKLNFTTIAVILHYVILKGSNGATNECRKKLINQDNIVCVCDATYCDTIEPLQKINPPNFVKYTTNKAGLRFEKSVGTFDNNDKPSRRVLTVDRNKKYQTIIGWGGAFTDATGINIKSLPVNAQAHLLNSYFGPAGLEYSLGRVPIGGTDFSTRSYSYDDVTEGPDPNLEHFKLAPEDFNYKIPYILKALELSQNKLKLFASAWTAPSWMKTNHGSIKRKYRRVWVDYFVRFLEEYLENDVPFWGITTGNEPSLALAPMKLINTVAWTPLSQVQWIAKDFGPVLRTKFPNLTLMALDDQRSFIPAVLPIVLLNREALNYIDGIAVHWYHNSFVPAKIMTATHDLLPGKFILGTEACEGFSARDKGVRLGSWKRAENYINDIILDLENWVTGWTDWNMALDLTGGPTYIKNFVDSPIIVNASGGEFYKQPMFYGLGHFSKFLPPNSRRIAMTGKTNLQAVAFETPPNNDDSGNSTVLEIFNRNKENEEVSIRDDVRGTISLNLTPHSITTVIYW